VAAVRRSRKGGPPRGDRAGALAERRCAINWYIAERYGWHALVRLGNRHVPPTFAHPTMSLQNIIDLHA